MQFAIRSSAALFTLFVIGVAHAAEPTTIDVTVPKGDELKVQIPAGWEHRLGASKIVPALNVEEKKSQLKMQIFFFAAEPSATADPARAAGLVERSVEDYLPDTVEKKATIKPIQSKKGHGSYCSLTDAEVVALKEEVPPGNYRNMTKGVFVIGKQRVMFTINSNGTDSMEFEQALQLIAAGITVAAK